jgi:hypothetical protein
MDGRGTYPYAAEDTYRSEDTPSSDLQVIYNLISILYRSLIDPIDGIDIIMADWRLGLVLMSRPPREWLQGPPSCRYAMQVIFAPSPRTS